ncbi:DNA-3-methyladenine glycosylase I [Alisedimentitalea sp. MJ-SS2]|uniref:DNA-3-methyladenine glycosylase I n=1 Tax=Aliisedimentitalea sp. MJ-SS2 TaxID=3049795 RepID=UPI0029079709|nr:DNA-3-methyladenine glycosylase I [Alisedimentitalea sp. MJ-SS2]MDU8927291.1 DNA-3-methyladenine glycosylase I [Alisedimentitalea sp. MJ-SS2]
MTALTQGPDGQARCKWCEGYAPFVPYHDTEWGFPVNNDIRLFEKLCLESFQSGLSWRTILDKRENFRAAFDGFDFNKMATYDEADVERLLQNAGIIRHRGKIEAVINNAARAQEIIADYGSLAAYVWSFEPPESEIPEPQSLTMSPASHAMSKDMKKKGWKFVGPTTVFAFMQSMGLINDHAKGCVIRDQVATARAGFARPQAK